VTELCVIHPGELSPLSWPRIARHLPEGTRLRVLELEALNGYWEHDPAATVTGLADRLRVTLDPRIDRLLVGWGVGGVIAEALAARMAVRPRRTFLLDTVAPYVAHRPSDADLRRSYAMLVCARRGRAHLIPTDGLDSMLERLAELGFGAVDILRKGYFQHARTHQFNARLIASHQPSGVPVTVVQPTDSLYGDLGWHYSNPVESLASGGDHYSMLTAPDHAVQLALLLSRWLTPSLVAV
jgi:pimeloyl-ACP methyl ester carboxylesterase